MPILMVPILPAGREERKFILRHCKQLSVCLISLTGK